MFGEMNVITIIEFGTAPSEISESWVGRLRLTVSTDN
jgi:hypothetical protein